VGTDRSRGANRAIVAAAQLAQVTGAELCIHTVGSNLSGQELKKLGRIEGDIGEGLELLSNQVLNQKNGRCRVARRRSNFVQARASPPK
jgi:hypothetical protein